MNLPGFDRASLLTHAGNLTCEGLGHVAYGKRARLLVGFWRPPLMGPIASNTCRKKDSVQRPSRGCCAAKRGADGAARRPCPFTTQGHLTSSVPVRIV